MASTYLTNTFGTPTNQNIWTFSCWIKRSNDNVAETIFAPDIPNGSIYNQMLLRADGTLQWYGTDDAGGNSMDLTTNRVFGDINAWYHLVFAWDSTQGTASNRAKLYVNGVQETSFSTATYPVQNSTAVYTWNEASRLHSLGARRYTGSPTGYFSGSMSHVHFCDGTALAPTVFGSTDATTGEWKINTSPTFTLGTNGFTILKDGNTITDQSSNSNDFTLASGTLTKTEDCPSNVFCTLNPLVNPNSATLSNGNTHSNKSSAHAIVQSTIACGYPNAPSTAKFYWETKMEATDGRTVGLIKSNIPQNTTWFDDYLGANSGGDGVIGYYLGNYVSSSQSIISYNGTSPAITISTGFSTGDVMVHAYDANTGKYWQGKNGVWFTYGGGVGNPATGAYPLVTLNATDREHFIFPAESSQDGRWSWNFGNGYFKTTAVSSAGTNASGIGIFEYDVPTGFTAISTKGLNA